MATKDYALTTKTRVKARIELTSTALDDVIDSMVYAVTDFIERKCQRRFKRTTYTQEVYSGSHLNQAGSRIKHLILKNAPIISISALQYNAGTFGSPSWVDFTSEDYTIMAEMGVVLFPNGMPSGYNNIRVTYVAGYLIDYTSYATALNETNHTLPVDLSDLAERMVVKLIKRRESEGRASETIASGSTITWENLLSAMDKEILREHMRTTV
jgi:hypothetical protein